MTADALALRFKLSKHATEITVTDLFFCSLKMLIDFFYISKGRITVRSDISTILVYFLFNVSIVQNVNNLVSMIRFIAPDHLYLIILNLEKVLSLNLKLETIVNKISERTIIRTLAW